VSADEVVVVIAWIVALAHYHFLLTKTKQTRLSCCHTKQSDRVECEISTDKDKDW
jgi:hypothetical protein